MTSNLTPVFKAFSLVVILVFLGAIFFVIFKALKLDYVQIIKDKFSGKKKKRAYNQGFLDGLMRPQKNTPCENEVCDNAAGKNGGLVKKNKSRKIVCAECLPAYVKLGWEVVMSWGEEFKALATVISWGAASEVFPKILLDATPPHLDFWSLTMGFVLGLIWTIILFDPMKWRKTKDEN